MGMSGTILVILVFACVTVFVGFAYRYHVREMEHKQVLAAIDKGVDPPLPQMAPWTPRTYLLHGMIWLFAGLASFVALSAIAVTSRRQIPIEVTVRAATEAREQGATPEEIQMLLHIAAGRGGISDSPRVPGTHPHRRRTRLPYLLPGGKQEAVILKLGVHIVCPFPL